MTVFEMKQQEAKLRAQAALKQFGLELDTRISSWYYTDSTCKRGVLTTYSERYPLKGNKALIEQIKAAGYHVEVIRSRAYETRGKMLFWVEVRAEYDVAETIKKG